jgi:ketosteroid isomerase-like protein
MKALVKTVLVLLGCLSLGPALAQVPKTPSEDSIVVNTIKQIERDWVDAIIASNVDRLDQIVADDWIDIVPSGKTVTKEGFLSYVKSERNNLESCEFGPVDVKVLGHVAVAQGSVTERRTADGQSRTARLAFMDVFVKRGDRWVVVRSRAHKL